MVYAVTARESHKLVKKWYMVLGCARAKVLLRRGRARIASPCGPAAGLGHARAALALTTHYQYSPLCSDYYIESMPFRAIRVACFSTKRRWLSILVILILILLFATFAAGYQSRFVAFVFSKMLTTKHTSEELEAMIPLQDGEKVGHQS